MSILEYSFFQNALIGSLLASIVCGIIGTYIVSRRLVFISGGITHASFGGIGLGVFLAKNMTGYKNLMKLASIASEDDRFYRKPRVKRKE